MPAKEKKTPAISDGAFHFVRIGLEARLQPFSFGGSARRLKKMQFPDCHD